MKTRMSYFDMLVVAQGTGLVLEKRLCASFFSFPWVSMLKYVPSLYILVTTNKASLSLIRDSNALPFITKLHSCRSLFRTDRTRFSFVFDKRNSFPPRHHSHFSEPFKS